MPGYNDGELRRRVADLAKFDPSLAGGVKVGFAQPTFFHGTSGKARGTAKLAAFIDSLCNGTDCGGLFARFGRCFGLLVLILSSQPSFCQPKNDTAPASIEAALGIQPSLNQLSALVQQGQGGSTDAIMFRQDILEKLMQASFDFDSVLARIQVEIAYTEETRRLLDNRTKRRESRYSLASFLTGGATGTAGSAMSLTSNLSHSGTVVGLVGGSSVLALALAHSVASNLKQQVQSPLNMLAQILGTPPNSKSSYPPTVTTLISVPGPEGGLYVAQLPDRWKQLERLQAQERVKAGSSIASVTSDLDQHVQATSDELLNREAMLLDLNAALLAMRSRLGSILNDARRR